MTLPIPNEEVEQRAFVQWLELKGLPYWHTPNSTFTKSWQIKNRNSALGVKAGIPDLFIVLPHGLLAIEMKRIKGGVVSPAQKYWLETLNNAGVKAHVAKGCQEAIIITELLLKTTTVIHDMAIELSDQIDSSF